MFNFEESLALGAVVSVDTLTALIRVDDLERLQRIQVNKLVVLQSSRAGYFLIGVVTKITRRAEDGYDDPVSDIDPIAVRPSENNMVRITLIGTLVSRRGEERNVFLRTLEVVPDIDSKCFPLDGEQLTKFMEVISDDDRTGPRLSLGKFTLDEEAEAYLNGNRLFQRHAVIVGSTGSGKSCTTARLLEQIAQLPQSNVIVFDIHNEYSPLVGDAFQHFRIAGPGDLDAENGVAENVLHLPYWLLGYEALVSIFVDRSDQNAPNQAMIMTTQILEAKKELLAAAGADEILANFTIDSPVPFSIDTVLAELKRLNEERVDGARAGGRQGDYYGKLSRLIARLEAKRDDRRLGFLFQPPSETMEMEWLETMVHRLVGGRGSQLEQKGGIKIIDFSEVPSDILPLVVSLMARLVFSTNQWTPREDQHPVALFCDEAHLYIPEHLSGEGQDEISVRIFERIAKEGRKYGVGLLVISQRPSEVNRTVMSQCNNVIAMRLTNADDQSVIRHLLPDNLGSFGDLLPILDTGEALVVGDAILLPTRVRVTLPTMKPNSQTVKFWDRWNEENPKHSTGEAVKAWRRQRVSAPN